MDRSLYVAMTGATQILRAQTEVSHNLANASTTGFKAELSAFHALPVLGDGMPTRINAVDRGSGYDFTPGTQSTTGRNLDVAVQGQGWIAVQSPDGSEGYTRAGNLQLTPDGMLTDARGDPVLGDGGPITVPPSAQVAIGADGTLSVVPLGEKPNAMVSVGRIRLVNPPSDQLEQGGDGLMHLANGGSALADANVHLASGVLEDSNVNPSTALVKMIALSRQFEMQMQTIHNDDQNAQAASQLLQAS
ncbi:MAG TPA: flagellar basal-body rod protein FlgF [Rhodanobacteraceae bacterium]|nr:flagellar basal-body rod protein FlgF [Rhodanobacteraceae bacterium]